MVNNKREIKFRAWDKIEKKFQQWKDIRVGEYGFMEDIFENRHFVWQQFTGLKDKNGKEIYEGDIVYLAGYGEYEARFPFIELYEASNENDIGEVIGNIYENPNLLK